MIDRRAFIVGGVAAVAAPIAAGAQQTGKIYRIATLHTTVPEDASERVTAFERSLAELGYVEGRNVAFVHRYSGPEVKRLGDLASELVLAGVDVIVTSTNPSTVATMKATTTVPIVMTIAVEPVAARLVKSITKPGGNVTGLTFDVDRHSSPRSAWRSSSNSSRRWSVLRSSGIPPTSREPCGSKGRKRPVGSSEWRSFRYH